MDEFIIYFYDHMIPTNICTSTRCVELIDTCLTGDISC